MPSHRLFLPAPSSAGLFFAALVLLLSLLPASPAAAEANCWCKVQCTFPGADTVEGQESWSQRPDGRNFNYPHSQNEWDECKDYCRGFVYELPLEEMAENRNSCGTVECASNYWLGARPERQGETRRVQVPCGDGADESDFQYAVKVVCGSAGDGDPLHMGGYKTTVNVHNPALEPVRTRHKLAVAGPRRDGSISPFFQGQIGADGAQYYDCRYFHRLANTTALVDGFFVLESQSELDVTAYYTSTDATQVNAIHIERYPGRAVAPRPFDCQDRVAIDLSDPQNWSGPNGTVVPVTALNGSWDANRTWISYAADGQLAGGTYTYQVDFCCCPNGSFSARGTVRSDDGSTGTVTPGGTALFNLPAGNFQASAGPAAPFNATGTCEGSGTVTVQVTNGFAGPSGLSMAGTLTLINGYAGACRTP
ncbi:MAG: hypothetical protein SX243_09875 [Acidobacteriota bacterium]|nr:hypothetical protein [Acidobacteriota bacterium]